MGLDLHGAKMDAVIIEEFWKNRPSLAVPGRSLLGGRGLFALSLLDEGALIDTATTVEIAQEQCKLLDRLRPLGDYYFAHPDNPEAGLMAFGLMSLCNHADDANGDIGWLFDEKIGWLAQLVAKRRIRPGEEITYCYKCPLWFEKND